MRLDGQKITVLGAGIAGLAVARALALKGARVEVLEQAGAIQEVGAGLQISPNGARVLRALGLGEAFADTGLRAAAVELRDGRDGGLVTRLDLGRLRPGQEYRFLHRADLIDLLAAGARAAGVTITTGRRIEMADLGPDGPVLHDAAGQGLRPGLVIGADGLHSVLRHALNGPHDGAAKPFFTRQAAWRAVIPAEPDAPAAAEVHMGAGRHVVSYPLRGGALRNIVAIEERDRWTEEGWALKDDPIALRLAFSGFGPRVRGWLDQVEDCWLWGLHRHHVARHWVWTGAQGAAAILGDAAHPTLPFLAQGANMALEDAWVLAQKLAGAEDAAGLAPALAAYQAARVPRCARIVEAANANARAYHLGGLPREVAHLGLRLAGSLAPGAMLRRFDWIYDHDVTAG